MDEISLVDYLNADSRPSFVLDLKKDFPPIFKNVAWNSAVGLSGALNVDNVNNKVLHSWARDPKSAKCTTLDACWTAITIKGRYRVISHVPILHEIAESSLQPTLLANAYPLNVRSQQEALQHHALVEKTKQHLLSHGGLSFWPAELDLAVDLIMKDPRPSVLYIGFEHFIFYNLAFADMLGDRHPSVFGWPILKAWPSAADIVIEASISAMQGDMVRNDYVTHSVSGVLEENIYQWLTIPLETTLEGCMYAQCNNITANYLSARRNSTLERLRHVYKTGQSGDEFYKAISDALATNTLDIPFALVFSSKDGECTLQAAVGQDWPDVPETVALELPSTGLGVCLQTAAKANEPIRFDQDQLLLSEAFWSGTRTTGFGDTCSSAVVVPITPSRSEKHIGFLVMGKFSCS